MCHPSVCFPAVALTLMLLRQLGEALLGLGNLTKDEKAREKLYSEAKEYGVDVDAMDE